MSSWPEDERRTWLDSLADDEVRVLEYEWSYWGRPSQQPPGGEWRTWLILAGRGWGKTRTGAEWIRSCVRDFELVNVIAPTADDARDVMIEGESGILAVCPNDERPFYLPSKRQLAWPNGAKTLIFTADEPDRLRGKQHMRLWADELAAWRYPEAWDQAMLGLRLGSDPRAVVTTTPKPTKLVRELAESPTTHLTRGSTYENSVNLAPAFLEKIVSKYEGTRLGRQELTAEILTDVVGALWTYATFENRHAAPDLARVVVAVDPAATSGEDSDETGIVVAGKGVDGRGYVLADRTCRLSPLGWAQRAIAAYDEFSADAVVIEVNQGGEMAAQTLKTVRPTLPIRTVHASRGKVVRAQPVASLYEQGKVTHVAVFEELEEQLTSWTPESGTSPDRLDALVYALTEVMQPGGTLEWY